MEMLDILSAFSLKAGYRRIKRRLGGCCLLVLLTLLLICGALFGLSFLLARRAGAQGPNGKQMEVMLLIDNSNSMWEKSGVGSDPDLLRIEAARLFITYLGVDSRGPAHRLGMIFFGSQAELVVPLTPLADDARRAEMLKLIAGPSRMGWTDPNAALDLAGKSFGATDASRAVVLLTDGKPEWNTSPTAQEQAETIARLRETAGRFAADGVPLFIILLQNKATDADPEIEEVFVPLWQEMAQATPLGHFFRARQNKDLLDIYHDIIIALTGRDTAGVVLQTQARIDTLEGISVEPGLAQVTFVIRKSDPALQVTILRPDGQALTPDAAGVQYGGQPGHSHEEVWAVDDPEAGNWQIHLNGQGTVTIWKDFYPAPATPVPSPTRTRTPTPSPAHTSTPSPTRKPTPLPTAATPTPTSLLGPLPRLRLSEPNAPVALRPGDSLPVVATWLPGAHILAYLESAGGVRIDETSLSEADEGRYIGQLSLPPRKVPSTPGGYLLRLQGQAELSGGLTIEDELSLPVTLRANRWWAWWWLGLPVKALLTLGGWLWYQRRRTTPLLDGTLRRIRAPAGQEVPARLDLDTLRHKTISIGPDPRAGLHLPDTPDCPTPRTQLAARREAGGQSNVILLVEATQNENREVLVNQLPVTSEWALHDGDVIQLGAYRFRYENLRRRASAYRPMSNYEEDML